MTTQFETFHSFQDHAIALELATVLNNSGIQCRIVSNPRMLDAQIVGVDSGPDYALKVRPEDFKPANDVLNSFYETQVAAVDKDYFLFSFSNEELNDILKKPDEWGFLNSLLAKKILHDRGVPLTDAMLEKFKRERKKDLGARESPGMFLYVTAWVLIIIGVIFTISPLFQYQDFIMLCLPVFSLLIGRHIINYKKIMPDGEMVLGYHESDRKRGRFIFYVAISVILITAGKLLFWGMAS